MVVCVDGGMRQLQFWWYVSIGPRYGGRHARLQNQR